MTLAGSLAIATPKLDATPFSRAVVLVIQHNNQGAFGVVLNRPANEQIKRVWETMTGTVNDSYRNISLGGPFSGPVFALHQSENLGDHQVQCGLFFSASKESLQKLARIRCAYRIFFGAAAWTRGQLEGEIDEGAWIICPATEEIIFANPDSQWENAIRHFGREMWRALGIRHFPSSPLNN